jgi:hypothetical protein
MQMAALMTRTPGLKATTAARRIIPAISESHLRRLQVKWKEEGHKFMNAASHQNDPSMTDEGLAASGAGSRIQSQGESETTMNTHFDSGEMLQRLQNQLSIAAWVAEENLSRMNQPAADAIRRYEEQMRQFQDSPAMKHFREHEERMRRFQDSPAMKLFREHEERMRKVRR